MKNAHRSFIQKSVRRDHIGDLGIDRKIILKLSLKK
jgi:hypothetical protein